MSNAVQDPTVLIIDDDALVRLSVGETLREAGCVVVEAASAEEGLECFDLEIPDLVLLDIMLPGMSGYEACVRLRAHPGGRDIPIIVMTGLDDRKSIREAYDSGATDFITKPVVSDLLPYRVRYALRASRALQDAVRSEALLASSQRIANMGSWEWVQASGSLECSEEWHKIHGGKSGSACEGVSVLRARIHPSDVDKVNEAMDLTFSDGIPYRIDFRIVRPDGSIRRLFEQTEIERDSKGAVVAVRGISQDITQQIEADHRIRRLAYFDQLTGLANRSLFREMMQRWLPYASRRGLGCAVLFIGLDRFKLINETYGPRVGDEALRVVSERLRECVRADDIASVSSEEGFEELVARLSGDEFTVLLVDIAEPDQASRVAARIMGSISEPIAVEEGYELLVSASIGIAMVPHDGDDADVLLRNAETAMHAAKESGRGQIRFYNQAMSKVVSKRLSIETELRRALENGDLRVYFQSKVDARTSALVGAEALLRWQHPVRGLVSPADFIPVAEDSGLIVPITDWIIRAVCKELAGWRRQGYSVVPISINLAAVSLEKEGLVDSIKQALAESGVAPHEIEFEVTESTLMRDMARANQLLNELKGMGLKISIDDFGTGYSSLTYLKRFPVDVLKIDRSFVMDITTDVNDAAITSAIIAMGGSLNLQLIAEGVETLAQLDFLLERGCYLMQGFLFAKPVPNDAFAVLLRSGIILPTESRRSGPIITET